MRDLRDRTILAGVANVFGRAVSVLLRIFSIMILARLVSPRDYGLVGMVYAFIGFFNTVANFGLFQAAVQHDTMTEEQSSTLFWINLLFGGILTMLAIALAPFISAFYHEPQLVSVTSVVACGFFLNGAGVQHAALLQRQLRFVASALISISGALVGTAVAIGMALAGCGYWAVVSMSVSVPLTLTLCNWLATGWIPGKLRRNCDIRSMVNFGGTMTLNGLVGYVGTNFGRMLLGRFWGPATLGIYDRAFTLIMVPTDNLNWAIGEVALAALSRTRDDPDRLRRYFLKGYSLVIALSLPISTMGAIFSDELIFVVLGDKWGDAAGIFRILLPTILVSAIVDPLGWLIDALGRVKRSLKIAMVVAPFVMVGATIGLPYGPKGVAIAYSGVMMMKLIPVIVWTVQGTPIRICDVLRALGPPVISSVAAAFFAWGAHILYTSAFPAFERLASDVAIFVAVYVVILLLVTEQRSLYIDLLRSTKLAALPFGVKCWRAFVEVRSAAKF
jgi:O-antigen/teichoic acid export membrane protein